MKNFIRGCGTGILIATLILTIAYMLTDRGISDSEVIARAKKLGMVEADATVIRQQNGEVTQEALQQEDNIESVQTPSGADVQQTQNVQDSASPAEEGGDGITPTEPPAATASTAEQTNMPDDTEGDTISVTIKPGQDGVSISQMLQDKGVVTDASDFNNYLSSNRLQMNIRHGTFELQKNMSYEELVKKIIY